VTKLSKDDIRKLVAVEALNYWGSGDRPGKWASDEKWPMWPMVITPGTPALSKEEYDKFCTEWENCIIAISAHLHEVVQDSPLTKGLIDLHQKRSASA
jgi:hypothetical protein